MPLFPFDCHTQKSFNPNVLVGNWFEERCDRMVDKKAIVPGVYGHSTCSNVKSIYVDTYKQPALESQEYCEFKRQRFINKLNSRATHFTTKDSKEFDQNMTSTTDLMYNIRPKIAKIEAETGQKLLEKNEEMMQNYNQSTDIGLLRSIRYNRLCEERACPITTYKDHYKSKRLNCPRERNWYELCGKYKVPPPFYAEAR